jgi:hypothetical protein
MALSPLNEPPSAGYADGREAGTGVQATHMTMQRAIMLNMRVAFGILSKNGNEYF